MTILCNELTLEQINSALLRLQRSMQNSTNNFQNDVEKAVANVTINSKNTVQRYDDSYLMSIVTDIRDKYKDLVKTDQDILRSIINLETILASVSLNYDEVENVITFNLGDYSTSFTLKDTTYTFSYDTETGHFTIVDNVTGETVFEETFNDTTYTFSFTNGILTVHNNLLNTDQTFNFDSRYYTEAEIQALILDKIPSEASSTNQLADKAFVNSSISTATATFRGTVTTTQALAALTGDLNDYAFLQNIDPTTGQTLSYDRYKWVESGGDYGHWKYEYTLNNSSFTSDQWAAINSGITCQIVTDLLDGCYSGTGSALCKSDGNEWRNILATNCDCSGSVDADYIYYNTNIRVNQRTGALSANCYSVSGHGYAKFAAPNLVATCIGLTAGCTYPLTCILESIMACCGYNAGTYTFLYSNAQNPIICETGGYAYCAVFTKEDYYNPVANTWQMTRWRITLNDGRSYCASAYSAANAGIACWNVNGSAAVRISRNPTTCDGSCHLALLGDNTSNQLSCIYVSNGCSATFNPATGTLSAKCFVGDNQYHAVIPSPQGNTSTYYATIVLDDTCVNAETSIVFNSYYAEYHLLTWSNGSSCLTEVKDLWYVDYKYSIDSVGVSTCKANTDCIYIKYCGYRPTVVNSSRKIKCIISGCKTAPSNVSWTTALKGIGCSRNATCFGGCTYADACADIRSGLISGGSFNGTAGTVSNGCLSFSDINFDNICNSTRKCVAANNITRRHIITNQISKVGFITRWGLGLERGTTCWGTGLLSLGVSDNGTRFADYKFTHDGSISLTCCGTARCITLYGCATKNVFTCCLGSANATRRYFQIKTKANRGSHSVSFDFDFYSMNGTINLDCETQEYTGTCYAGLQVARCEYTCTCCDCFWLTYAGYRTLTLKSVYDFEVLCNTTTAPTGVTFSNLSYRLGAVCKVAADQNDDYNLLMSNASNNTRITQLGSASGLTYNPSTGVLNVICGTCIGWNRTKSTCVKVTPTAQSSCWIYIGRFQTNGTGDTINTYNDLNLTIAAVGNGMVSSANVKVLSANATSPTVIVQRQAGYSASTGIDCVAVTRSGTVWSCYVCVWARVKSYGTNAYYLHLYRNMLPDTWTTALTVCSAITGDIVGVGNVGINARAIQSNADLRIGSLTACTSSVAGCSGGSYGSGWIELYAPTPYIDFHTNNYCGDYSNRIASTSNGLVFFTSNGTGCTTSTGSSVYTMCSNGLLYSSKGFVAGCVNAACSFLSINCACGPRMISMTRDTGAEVGLLLTHCADWTGTTHCNLGIEVGSGNVNRGFYHCKAGTFEWLQYWDATLERHSCPQCFACIIYGCSGATFAGMVSSCNTERWSTVYSSNTYNTGYYLIAEYKTNENGYGNHDITLGGKVDAYPSTSMCKTWRFKAFMRGNKCSVYANRVFVDSAEAVDWLCFTRSVDTATCTFALRVYARISGSYSRYNTTIDYLAGNDVGVRYGLNSGCLTFPNTYAADTSAFVGTLITPSCSCGQLTASSYKTEALSISCTFAANSTSYILLGCYRPANTAYNANELDLGFAAGGGSLVEKGSIKLLLTTGNGSCFCNNNIDVKMSNYVVGSDRPGICAIGFTTSGNTWNCKIGVWLAVRNNTSAANTWAVDLLRNKVDSKWETCMTCTATMPTFVCTVQVPSTQNFHFNNAYSMLNQWSYETNASQTACMRYATLVIGQVNCVRKPTHQKLLVTTTITGSENPLNMWIEYMGGYGDKDFLQACYSGGNCNVIIPMRIGSDSENIYIDFAVCCSVSRTICSDVYSSGNMQLGSKGNALRAYPYTLSYVPQENVYTCIMSQWPTTIIFNVDDPASQFATRVIAANTISAYCMATTSDVRQKKDIVPYNKGLCDVKNLDIISFRYKSEDDKAIKHVSVPANWTCQLISGKNQDQFRVNDTVGILLSAVKDLSQSMTLAQKIKLWFYKKFVEPKNNKKLNEKLSQYD